MIGGVQWQRRVEWVHRELSGRAMLARSDGERRTLGGLATAVWVVLDEPGSTAEVVVRLQELGPEQQIDEAAVLEALEMLADADVITTITPD